jgi:hypothetical protein
VAKVAGDLAEPIDHDTLEAIAIRNNLVDAARTVLGKLRSQELEVVVAAMIESVATPLHGLDKVRQSLGATGSGPL